MSYHTLMHRRAHPRAVLSLVLSLAVVGVGCGHPVQRKLEGRWIGNGVESFHDDLIAIATGWAKGATLEFAGSSLTVAIPAEEPRTGSFKVVGVHQNNVTLAVTRRDGAVDTLRLKLDDDREMRWMVGSGRAVVLRRED
jgi:hypothetical protein